jgi:hypothetical protein
MVLRLRHRKQRHLLRVRQPLRFRPRHPLRKSLLKLQSLRRLRRLRLRPVFPRRSRQLPLRQRP